jgi:tetratricopeptide (TPR) repeat protein
LLLQYFNARKAAEIGTELADRFALNWSAYGRINIHSEHAQSLTELLRHVASDMPTVRLNIYKRAKLAQCFKWRLLENGVDGEIADAVTQNLVLHLALNRSCAAPGRGPSTALGRRDSGKKQQLFAQANEYFAQGAYAESVAVYQELVRRYPRYCDALHNLGAALTKLGRYKEAQVLFRQVIAINPSHAQAHCNLGTVLRWSGDIAESEISLRRALTLNPSYAAARTSLGETLVVHGRLREAQVNFAKVLKVAPRDADALFAMGQVAQFEGRFDEARGTYERALAVNPKMPRVLGALVGLRKMTASDGAWLQVAEEVAAGGLPPLEEAGLRFAIGKYLDDVETFERAFQNYQRANQLLRAVAEKYDRERRTRYVDDLISGYSRKMTSNVGGDSASMRPVFVVGMMRSGTSLAEQIIASHSAVHGAGELSFWSDAVREHETSIRQGLLDDPTRQRLAAAYLRVLSEHSADALRIIDKSPANSDHLGVIHSVFPNARIIYMRRDPIDSCLSCYFQQFSIALNFTVDLSDLAHYYREHKRLVAHWRAVLPPGTILDVPYAELVADPETWTRKMLTFIGLEWDERCLDFDKTRRAVVTASYWQVRQKIHKDSVGRWHNYRKFIRPLLDLKDLDNFEPAEVP